MNYELLMGEALAEARVALAAQAEESAAGGTRAGVQAARSSRLPVGQRA